MSNTKDTLPAKIQILTHVEIYVRGNVLTLQGNNTYSYPGAVFGITVERALWAIKNGDATTNIDDNIRTV